MVARPTSATLAVLSRVSRMLLLLTSLRRVTAGGWPNTRHRSNQLFVFVFVSGRSASEEPSRVQLCSQIVHCGAW